MTDTATLIFPDNFEAGVQALFAALIEFDAQRQAAAGANREANGKRGMTMVARGVWTRDRLGIDRDPRPATDEEYAEWQERKAAREMQTQLEHAEHLAAKYRITQEQINAVFSRLLAEYEPLPLPFTNHCNVIMALEDDLVDLHETQKDAIA